MNSLYDIIIIGAGPAGLTAAIYGRRANKKVLVLESTSYGGRIISAKEIENYPGFINISGVDFANKLYEQAKSIGALIVFERVDSIEDLIEYKSVSTNKNTYKGKSVIIANGINNKKIGLPNERELTGKGISYCATCDGAFYKGKTVAVVGGGNTALEDALYLADVASKVYLIHRRDEFRGEESTVSHLKEKDNIEFVYNSNVTKLNANERLKSIEITNIDGSIKTIDVDGLFVAVGRIPENQNFAKLINLDESGYIKAGEDCITNVAGILLLEIIVLKRLDN